MRVRNRVSLCVESKHLEPAEISRRVGLEPDKTRLMGSRVQGPPPIPRSHLWELRSGLSEKSMLDDHFGALLGRCAPWASELGALVDAGLAEVAVVVVRYFDGGAEDPAVVAAADADVPESLERIRGQHPLLGAHVDSELLAFLALAQAELDFDEYADELE